MSREAAPDIDSSKTEPFRRAVLYLFIFTIALLPLQPFWIRLARVAQWPEDVIFWLTNWGGLTILLTVFVSAGGLLFRKMNPRKADILLLAYLLVAFLSFFWREGTATDYLTGLRYSAFAVLGYFNGRTNQLWRDKIENVLVAIYCLVALLAFWQLTLWLFGLADLSGALQLESGFSAGIWPRVYGSLPGPNHLATFLTISGLWLFWRGKIGLTPLAIGAAIVVLTLSRSAVLALSAGLIVPYAFSGLSKSRHWAFWSSLALAVAAIAALIYLVEPIRDGLLTARHTDERLSTYSQTITLLAASSPFQLVLGHGSGTAGPAAFVTGHGFIPENWFLQIAYEYGALGLSLLLSAWTALAVTASRRKQPYIVAVIVAMFVNSLFLHPLSDNIAAAIWFYLLLGLSVSDSLRT